MSQYLGKTKEFYKAKSAELEKLKRESPSPKELEKAETKFRKAQVSHKTGIMASILDSTFQFHQDDYKALCDKYASVREDFEKKMLSSTYFQFKKGNLPKLALELPAVETTERWVRTSIPFPPPPPFAPFPPPFTPPVSLDLPPPSGKSSTAGVR